MRVQTWLALILGVGLLSLCLASPARAHILYMTVMDNQDGSVTVEGMYSTGGVAAATPVRLEDAQGKVLFKGQTDEEGALTFDKPGKPYTIIMDAGPGHTATEKGPK